MSVVLSDNSIMPLTIRGSLEDGGYTATFSMVNAADLIEPDQEITIYVDDKFGSQWHGSHLVFKGYVPSGEIKLDKDSGIFSVTAHTADYMLRRLFLPGTAFREGADENTKTPSTLTLSYIINNILVRMTNASQYITWHLEDSDYQIAEYSIDEGDPWSWFEEIAGYEQRLLYFTRNNELYYKKHPMFGAIPPPAIFDFNLDTMTDIQASELDPNQVSQVYVLGFYKYDTFTKLYPDLPVSTGGRLLEKKGIPVKTQADLDDIARRMFVSNNSKWAALVSDRRNHHLELADIVTVTHEDLDNDIDWSYGKRFYVNSCEFAFSMDNDVPTLNSRYDLKEIPDEIFFNA